MEIFMCVLLGILSMFILLHCSVLLLIAAELWKRREKKAVPEEAAEKTEEERKAEMEMKLFNEGVANILSYGNPKERDR